MAPRAAARTRLAHDLKVAALVLLWWLFFSPPHHSPVDGEAAAGDSR